MTEPMVKVTITYEDGRLDVYEYEEPSEPWMRYGMPLPVEIPEELFDRYRVARMALNSVCSEIQTKWPMSDHDFSDEAKAAHAERVAYWRARDDAERDAGEDWLRRLLTEDEKDDDE